MSLSVLVVDDDRTTRETLAEFFAALGYVAHTAATATEGRRAAAAHGSAGGGQGDRQAAARGLAGLRGG